MSRFSACLLGTIWLVSTAGAEGIELSGVVVGPEKHPVGEAVVWLVQERQARTARTDGEGAFHFADVALGPAQIVAYKSGLCFGGIDAHVIGPDHVEITLGEAGSIRLRVIDTAFQPIAGARVVALAFRQGFHVPVEDLMPAGLESIRSDAAGLLVIPNLPVREQVDIVIAHHQHPDLRVPGLFPGEEVQPVQMVRGVTVRGRTVNEEGAAIAGARVAIYRRGTAGEIEATEALTDSEGFYVARVRPGEYLVTARHPAYATPGPKELQAADLGSDQVVDLTMPPPCLIEGAVEAPDGTPCPGVWIAYLREDGLQERVLTAMDGTFRLQVAPGRGRVRVLPPDGFAMKQMQDLALDVDAGGPAIRVDAFKLEPLPAIDGFVVDEAGAAVPGALVSSLDIEPPLWVITDDEGRFRIQLARLPFERKARFRAEHGRRFLRGTFTVDFKKLKPVTVRLEPFEPDLRPNDPARARNNLGALVDRPAPELVCEEWFNSEPLTLAGLRGKVVVLTLWGGFAEHGPARDRIDELRALHDLFEGVDDVAFISVHDSGIEPEAARDYVEKYEVTFPVGFDVETADTFDLYDTHSIPQTVLIDRKGIVRYYEVDGRLLELIKSLRREG